MIEVVSVKFKGRGKAYYFAPVNEVYAEGEELVVETAKGLEVALCAYGNHYVTEDKIVPPLRPVIRRLTESDRRVLEINQGREQEAFGICQKKIAEHGLDMKLVDVECSFEGNKITFYFISDGRVDFRELVKDLAAVFRSRIELRQIGVRDEAKLLGGIGICGRPFCCHQFLDEFQPVSTKMAKVQSMSLNPSKISGNCGRLMCCLRYEEEAYEDLVKTVPKNGAFVETPSGYGNVVQVNLLRRQVKVKLDAEGDAEAEAVIKNYSADDVAVIPGGRPKPGEPLPQLLKHKPAPAVPEPEPDIDSASLWRMPRLIPEPEELWTEPAPPVQREEHRQQTGKRQNQNHRGKGSPRQPRQEQRRQDFQAQPAGQPPQRQYQPKSKRPQQQKGGKPKGPRPQPPRNVDAASEQSAPRRPHRRPPKNRGGRPRFED